MKYIHNESIINYLTNRKIADFVIKDGLNYLIPNWKKNVFNFDDEQSIFEYINDLSVRQIIDEIINLIDTIEQEIILKVLKPIDGQFLVKTFEINECLKRKKGNIALPYNRVDNWYYFRMPEKLFIFENNVNIKNYGKPRYTRKVESKGAAAK